MNFRQLFLGMALGSTLMSHAQNVKGKNAFDEWRKEIHEDFDNFRKEIMEDYLFFVENPWKAFKSEEPVPKPKDDQRPPVVMPEEDKDKPIENNETPIEEVIAPVVVEPQPEPIQPIEEVPVVEERYLSFTFFGTPAKVRFDVRNKIILKGLDNNSIAGALRGMATEEYDNMILDCLELRKKHSLSDWGYLQMLKAMADAIYGEGSNESELLIAYVYMQSGYRMRLATEGTHLFMLYASKHMIYDIDAYKVDNEIYYGLSPLPDRLYICPASYPKEQSMSLYISNSVKLNNKPANSRTIVSKHDPEAQVHLSVNQNLIDFYNTYPTSILGDNVMTRWAMYANTPIEENVRKELYPQLKSILSNKSQLEAANILLNWVQTGFVYKYDDEIWGGDRAFFAEESLYYPYCDCEDRSILYTRLVRDILGLKCILVFYPGHLATAVCFTENVNGDYIQLDGQKYIVSDPTYIGAPVGMTMDEMDNQSAKVILLE